MDLKMITEEDYSRLLKKLEEIEEVVREKIHPQKQYYTNEEVCKLFSISKRTLQNWRHDSVISYHKVTGVIIYSTEDIKALLVRNEVKRDPNAF
jgi:hypothetical protein